MENYSNKSLKHWIVLLCCCGLAASCIGSVMNTVGVFYTPVSEALGVLRGTFALQATILTLSIAFVSLIVPQLMKKFNFKLLIIVGSALVGGSTVLMAMASSMPVFYGLAIIKGVGAAIYNALLITTILNHWFKEKNGLVTSITLSFSGVAGAVLSPVLTNIISAQGWRFAYVVLGIISFALCVPAIIYPFHMDPREDHLLPYGATGVEEVKATNKSESHFNAATLTFILFLIMCVLFTSITGMPSHLPGYAESIKQTASVGALMLSATMVGNICSKLLIGVLSDKIGVVKSVIVMMIANVAAVVMMLIFKSKYPLIIASVIFGSCYSIGAVGISLLTRQFFGQENYAKAYSIVSFATNFGAAFAMTLIGYVYDFFGSYFYAFVFIILFNIINFLLLKYLSNKVKQ